ncbi:MAG: rhodanese-like domain-containing protein [Bacteroidota bacterium]
MKGLQRLALMRSVLPCIAYVLIVGCTEPSSQEEAVADISSVETSVVDISIKEVAKRLENVKVLDVRTAEEFAAGHVAGAINIDVKRDDFRDLVDELDRDQTYLVHCTANVEAGRSDRALKTMQNLGFTNLENMVGGYTAWVNQGGSVVVPEAGS